MKLVGTKVEYILVDKVRLNSGDSYDYWKSQDDVERLTRALRRNGYLGAVVDTQSMPVGENEVDVTYLIDAGTRLRRAAVCQHS